MANPNENAAKNHCSTESEELSHSPVIPPIRVDEFMRRMLPNASREWVRKRIAAGDCLVDGVARTSGFVVGPGMSVVWTATEPAPEILPEHLPLTVLFEDELLIAVDKPSGMLAHPTARVRCGTVLNGLCGLLGGVRPHLLHRLDRETSGVLVAAKRASRRVPPGRWFEERRVVKQYLAVLSGAPAWDSLTVMAPVGRDSKSTPRWNVQEDGLAAETQFRVLDRDGERTLVEARPVTGRTNQIRIHASAAGFPILGDEAYGGAPAERMLLHAWRLSLPYPSDDSRTDLEAPAPAGFFLQAVRNF